MDSEAVYESCIPIFENKGIEDEERTEKLEEHIKKEHALTGRNLEEAVLDVLWRFKESSNAEPKSPSAQNQPPRRGSPAPWQSPRMSSPLASPSLKGTNRAKPPTFGTTPTAFKRTPYGPASPFTSPRPTPSLAFATPLPHSPSLHRYEFSEPTYTTEDYSDLGGESIDWLVNEESESRPSSSGTGALNGAATSWIQPQQTEMSPHDMLRSVLGDVKSDEEIQAALEANGFDLSMTVMYLMGSGPPPEQTSSAQTDQQVLIGKSMTAEAPKTSNTSNKRSGIVCKYWLSNGNCLRADCRFSHDLSGHLCKYWVMGNCLAGESCIFSHDPAQLMGQLNLESTNAILQASPQFSNPSLQVQDFDNFPSLQQNIGGQWPGSPQMSPLILSGAPSNPNGYFPSIRKSLENRGNRLSGLSSSPASDGSRPNSRHQSRSQTPSLPGVNDDDAFPSLAAGLKGPKKHHGKRGGHGHHKENPPNTLADVVAMASSPSLGPSRKGHTRKGSYQVGRENVAAANAIPPPQHVPWLETGSKTNQAYLKARQEAIKHGGLRNKFLQSAAQAWNRNDARAAKALSLRGQSENDLMRKAHREAARMLYEDRNNSAGNGSETYVDLHGLHPEEAIEYLEQALMKQQKNHTLAINGATPYLYAIVGTGHHSKGGKDKVGKAIRAWLSEWKYAVKEFSVSGDTLGGLLGIDVRTFDRSQGTTMQMGIPDQGGAAVKSILGEKIQSIRQEDLRGPKVGAR